MDRAVEQETRFDRITLALQGLRLEAGSPSYAEIAQRVARLRVARGMSEAAAVPARTTVYDVFRTGRRRLDPVLLHDIVRALGVEETEVEAWTRDAGRAVVDPGPDSPPVPDPAPVPTPLGTGRVGLLLVSCLVLNLVGRAFVEAVPVPLYLDMVGTAVAAIAIGPWWGALVGVATNAAGSAISGPDSLAFAVVNVVGALLWGYGVRSWGMARTLGRYLMLNLSVAVACSVTAVPLIIWVLDGATSNDASRVALALTDVGATVFAAVLAANLVSSAADKVISGFVALVVAESVSGTPGSWPRAAS